MDRQKFIEKGEEEEENNNFNVKVKVIRVHHVSINCCKNFMIYCKNKIKLTSL